MKIRNYELDIDILEELQDFSWNSGIIRGDEFRACSPFRDETHPSFSINLYTGAWIDFGSSNEYYHSGNLVKLLAILRNEDYETTEEYLIEKYALILLDTDNLRLNIELDSQEKPVFIDRTNLDHLYKKFTNYLTKRGISLEIQKLFEIGYDSKNKAVAFLWTDKDNNIVNIKYRKVTKKAFYYEDEGQQIKNHLYGLYQCLQVKATRIFICESEIDALTLWTYGYPAVAVGGSFLSRKQKQRLLNSGAKELVIATDNDDVGKKFEKVLKFELGGYIVIYSISFPSGVKDINEMSQEQLLNAVQNLEKSTFSFLEQPQ